MTIPASRRPCDPGVPPDLSSQSPAADPHESHDASARRVGGRGAASGVERLGRHDLHVADCIEAMRTLPDASVDAVVTDPPYGTASASKVQKRGSNELVAFNISWDHDLPLEWISEAVRVLRPGGALCAFTDAMAAREVWDATEHSGARPLRHFYWTKDNPPHNPRKNFQSACEVGVFARKPGKVLAWNGGGCTPNVYNAPIVAGVERSEHPTQKPVSLMRWLVRLVTPPGGTVLEPFAGSGTTLLACELEGFRCIAIEREPEYAEIIRARYGAREVLRAMQSGPTPDAPTREAILRQRSLFGDS